jgi:ABC-type transport system involved in Fe-S cluster assembly fused permease/ATPase subunit
MANNKNYAQGLNHVSSQILVTNKTIVLKIKLVIHRFCSCSSNAQVLSSWLYHCVTILTSILYFNIKICIYRIEIHRPYVTLT